MKKHNARLVKTLDTSLIHILIEPEAPVGIKYPTVIFVHGLGADEHDLAGLAPYLDSRLMFLSVRAPFRLDWGGYTWYDFREAGQPEPGMFRESFDKLSQFICDALAQYPINHGQLFLFGFSMGTVMSLALALSKPELFRGVVANSGYLAEATHLTYRWNEIGSLDFYVAHGLSDPLIPVEASRIIREKMENAHAQVDYHEFAMAHEISPESLTHINTWLTQRLDSYS